MSWRDGGARLGGAFVLLAGLAVGAWTVLPGYGETSPVGGARAGASQPPAPESGPDQAGSDGQDSAGSDTDRARPGRDERAGKRAPSAEDGGSGGAELAVSEAPPPPSVDHGGEVLVASGFDRPVCGRYYSTRRDGCEFAVQGEVETGPFGGRSGESAVRIDRTSPNHMGVVTDLPLPGGGAFIGVAHRVPELPEGSIKSRPGHIQIMQLSPTDGDIPGHAVEVRLFPDRRLGLGLNGEEPTAMLDWPVPVDEWFYVVVQLASGPAATQRMWVYDSTDRLQAGMSTVLDTTQGGGRTAQKIGGSTPTTSAMYTFADDWYISTTFRGPARIGADGTFLGG